MDHNNEFASPADSSSLADYVYRKLIYQAGVDFESRPMLIFAACNLPDPKVISYNHIFELVVGRLDEYCECDYTVVFFASEATHQPGWRWMIDAYRRLDYKYKKNLKALYVVHPYWWTKLLFNIMGRIISPKFFRKIVWVETLSQLSTLVPIDQIDIPDKVRAFDVNLESMDASKRIRPVTNPEDHPRQHHCPNSNNGEAENRVFGTSVYRLMRQETGTVRLHSVVVHLIRSIFHRGLRYEGIFRRSPSSVQLKESRKQYNRGVMVDMSDKSINLPAVLLKLLFNELSQPMFGPEMEPLISALPTPTTTTTTTTSSSELTRANQSADQARELEQVRISYVRNTILPCFPDDALLLLTALFALLNLVSWQSEHNLMTAHNLAIVWGPNLYRTKNPLDDFHMYSADSHSNTLGAVLVLMINHFDLIFGNVLADKFGYNDLVDLDPAQWVVENLETIRVVTNGNDSSSPASAAREATT